VGWDDRPNLKDPKNNTPRVLGGKQRALKLKTGIAPEFRTKNQGSRTTQGRKEQSRKDWANLKHIRTGRVGKNLTKIVAKKKKEEIARGKKNRPQQQRNSGEQIKTRCAIMPLKKKGDRSTPNSTIEKGTRQTCQAGVTQENGEVEATEDTSAKEVRGKKPRGQRIK